MYFEQILFIFVGIFLILWILNYLKEVKLFKDCNYETLENKYKTIIDKNNTKFFQVAYLNLSAIYIFQQKYKEARECIDWLRNNRCNILIVDINEAVLLMRSEKNYSDAEKIINSALKKCNLFNYGYKIMLCNNLIEVLYHTDRVKEAQEMLDKLLKKHKRNCMLLTTQADLYFFQQDYINAKLFYNKALKYINNNYHYAQHKNHINENLNFINTNLK